MKVLARVSPFNEEQKVLVDIVTRESQRLNSIVSDFLAYSREKSYKLERTDLIPILEDALSLLENRSQNQELKIVRQFETSHAFAVADVDRMKQVFWNLLENAVRAMSGAGTITASVRAVGDKWRVGIHDTGTGISAQQIEKMFEPFQSNFEGGTGLGLAIVYQIVQAHGAKISVESQPGKGSEFILEILHAKQAAEPYDQRNSVPSSEVVSHG